MYSLNDPLTKETILNGFSQEQIFQHYLGIEVVFGRLIKSPLRKDAKPTCSFYYKNNTLYFRDFAGYFWGDCFSLVMKLENCSFYEALTKIYYSMKPTPQPKLTIKKDRTHSVLVKKREWNKIDIDYWYQYNITTSLLDYYSVIPCENVWIQKNGTTKLYYTWTGKNPTYAYKFDHGDYKVYNPLIKKFYMIKGHLEGYNQLPRTGEVLIITKSLKDVMCLRSFGVLAIAKSGESAIFTKEQYEELSKRFKTIYSLFDYDYAGICAANKIKKEFNIRPYFIPFKRLTFDRPNLEVKDISDFNKEYGTVKTRKIIDSILEYNLSEEELYKLIT